jgi:ubiquinol-cytochrome c reductase iron-sulfur subunit
MNPDASTIAAGAPIDVDLTPIAEGQDIKVFWRGKPIYISNRTKKQVEEVRAVPVNTLPDPATDQGDYDGFFCPCHGSQYDASGRIRRGPAPLNLAVPPYQFVSDTKIQIG